MSESRIDTSQIRRLTQLYNLCRFIKKSPISVTRGINGFMLDDNPQTTHIYHPQLKACLAYWHKGSSKLVLPVNILL